VQHEKKITFFHFSCQKTAQKFHIQVKAFCVNVQTLNTNSFTKFILMEKQK
jgi:hypothetical protein